MKSLFHMSCFRQHARLYQLADGRFQIVEQGRLAPLMIGYEYVLVEEDFADYLRTLNIPQVDIIDAIIFELWKKQEIRTHKQLLIHQKIWSDVTREIDPRSPDIIHRDVDLEGERFLLMDRQYVFATSRLRARLESSRFKYLRFTESLAEFAGQIRKIRPEKDDWRPDGKKILSPENLVAIERTLEDEGPIIVEHWHYYGSRAPDRMIFEDLDEFIAYVENKSRIGDAFHVWSFAAVCRDENEIASGKYPDEDGCVPRKGAY